MQRAKLSTAIAAIALLASSVGMAAAQNGSGWTAAGAAGTVQPGAKNGADSGNSSPQGTPGAAMKGDRKGASPTTGMGSTGSPNSSGQSQTGVNGAASGNGTVGK